MASREWLLGCGGSGVVRVWFFGVGCLHSFAHDLLDELRGLDQRSMGLIPDRQRPTLDENSLLALRRAVWGRDGIPLRAIERCLDRLPASISSVSRGFGGIRGSGDRDLELVGAFGNLCGVFILLRRLEFFLQRRLW